jgi:hypothetical protein
VLLGIRKKDGSLSKHFDNSPTKPRGGTSMIKPTDDHLADLTAKGLQRERPGDRAPRTYFEIAQSDGATNVTGQTPFGGPMLPLPDHLRDPTGIEPPLNEDINAMEPVGTIAEQAEAADLLRREKP